jgi:hypothetical protein
MSAPPRPDQPKELGRIREEFEEFLRFVTTNIEEIRREYEKAGKTVVIIDVYPPNLYGPGGVDPIWKRYRTAHQAALANLTRRRSSTRAMAIARAKARPWLVLDRLSLREFAELLPYLPDPRALQGRKTGSRADTKRLLAALTERVAAGERPTPAARDLLAECGVRTSIKDKADYLVRLLKKSGKK